MLWEIKIPSNWDSRDTMYDIVCGEEKIASSNSLSTVINIVNKHNSTIVELLLNERKNRERNYLSN